MGKKTIRKFLISVPTKEVETMMTRRYVRDIHGTEYPVDQEIQVPKRRVESLEVETTVKDNQIVENEQWALIQFPAGSFVEHIQDFTTITED